MLSSSEGGGELDHGACVAASSRRHGPGKQCRLTCTVPKFSSWCVIRNSLRGSSLSPAPLGNQDFSASKNSYITKNSYINLFEKGVVLGEL